MPRVTSDYVPAYRLHKSSGQAIVTLSGKDHLLGIFDTPQSRAKYHELISQWIAGGRKPLGVTQPPSSLVIDTRLTVEALVNAHLRHAVVYYVDADGQQTTEVRNFEDATKFLRQIFGPTPAEDFSPLKLKTVRRRMIDQGWARTLIDRHANRIKSIWKWAVSEELIKSTVYEALRTVTALPRGRSAAPEPAPVLPAPEEHIQAVRPFLPSPVWALVQLQRLTGTRGSELFKLRAVDIDTKGTVWIYTPRKHKTAHFGHKRIIYFGPRAQAVLKPFMADRAVDEYLFSPRDAHAETMRKRGTKGRRAKQPPSPRKSSRVIRDHYTAASYRKCIARACVKAKIDHWHPHQLRHTAATDWRREHGPEAALTLLGDKTTRMIDVYALKDHQTAMRIAGENG